MPLELVAQHDDVKSCRLVVQHLLPLRNLFSYWSCVKDRYEKRTINRMCAISRLNPPPQEIESLDLRQRSSRRAETRV